MPHRNLPPPLRCIVDTSKTIISLVRKKRIKEETLETENSLSGTTVLAEEEEGWVESTALATSRSLARRSRGVGSGGPGTRTRPAGDRRQSDERSRDEASGDGVMTTSRARRRRGSEQVAAAAAPAIDMVWLSSSALLFR